MIYDAAAAAATAAAIIMILINVRAVRFILWAHFDSIAQLIFDH